MGKKFCPQCNMNVNVTRKGGKKCCPCCGFNADYMGPAVSEQYSSTRPPSQNQSVVKPDVHDHDNRTFSQYTVGDAQVTVNVDMSDAIRFFAIFVIAASFICALYATFVTVGTYYMDDSTEFVGTMYQFFAFTDDLPGLFAIIILTVGVIVFTPRYVGIMYLIWGFANLAGAEYYVEGSAGFYALLLALVVGYLIHKWEKESGSGRVSVDRFYRVFWKGDKH